MTPTNLSPIGSKFLRVRTSPIRIFSRQIQVLAQVFPLSDSCPSLFLTKICESESQRARSGLKSLEFKNAGLRPAKTEFKFIGWGVGK